MNRLHLCIILITLKSWAFAYDFRAVDRYGNSLCFNLLSDSTAALTSEVAISFDSVVQNYPYLNCDTLYIPDSIEYDNYSYTICAIQGRALAYLNSVKRLYIPKTIIEIDNYSIGYKNSIQEFIVDNENPQFISKNGVLYSKDEKNLYCYPSNKIDSIFIIPEGVDNIEILAINNDIVKIIETPLSLKRVGVGALFSESIEELIFQDSLISFQPLAFVYIKNLKHLVFGNQLEDAFFGNIAYFNPLTVECRAKVSPQCIIYDNNPYIDVSILRVPRSSVSAYQQAEGWSKFGTILPIEPPIVASSNEATVSWVQNFSATGYVWHLYSDEAHTLLVMSLTFDERGYLTELTLGDGLPATATEHNRAAAPMRGTDGDENDGNERRFAEYYSFTIRSLSPDRQYYYVRQALSGEEIIDEEQGSFETLTDTETGLDGRAATEDTGVPTASKQLREGRVLIIAPDGSTYSPDGKELK